MTNQRICHPERGEGTSQTTFLYYYWCSMHKKWYVYIVTNQKNGTLYIGVTSNIQQRILQHKNKIYDWFTSKYWLDILVWFQEFSTIQEAISYEKKIKWWKRDRKLLLIEELNFNWINLAKNL